MKTTGRLGVVPCALSALSLLLVLGGCTWVDRFSPNTMVKSYQPLKGQQTPAVDGYLLDYAIQARDIGDTIGIDTFVLTIELKSIDKIKGSGDTTRLAFPKLTRLAIYLPATGDTMVLAGDRLISRSLDTPPTILHGRIYEYCHIRGVVLPDIHERIDVTVEFSVLDSATHQQQRTIVVRRQFSRHQQLKWYRI